MLLENGFESQLKAHMYRSIYLIRVELAFEIVNDYPCSIPALQDIKVCHLLIEVCFLFIVM